MTSDAVELSQAPEAQAASAIDQTARNRLVINILLVSAFVVILNETIMNVAIPPLMTSFEVTASAAQWLTTAFLITTAVVIPVTGFLLQRLNTRPIFMTAMTLFSLGTLLAALSPSLPVLIFARIVQASGTAIMMPLLMTTVMTLVPAESRGRTMGNISIVMSVAPAIGPTVAGLILAVLPWRWLFLLVLPIALIALVFGGRRMVNVTTPKDAPLDILSVILSAFAFGGLVYGLSNLGLPDAPVPGWIPLIIGLALMVVFVLRQIALQKRNAPLLDMRTFASRNFTMSVAMMVIAMMSMFGMIILLPLYLQDVLQLDTLKTGLLLLPGGLLMGLLGPWVGRLYDRVGPTRLIVFGMAVVSVVLWAMTLLDAHTSVWLILAGHLVISVGFAFLFTPLFTVSLSSLAPQYYSHGSAILGSLQQIAGAAGVALFVAIMSGRSASLASTGTAALDAQSSGITAAFFCGAVISIFAFVAAFFIRRPAEQPGAAPMMGH